MRTETYIELIHNEISQREDNQEERERLRELVTRWQKIEEQEFEHFVLEYVKDYREQFQQGERDKPPCTCKSPTCNLKDGEIPAGIKSRSNRLLGSMSFREATKHCLARSPHGDPVLREALDAWETRQGELKQDLMEFYGEVRE